MSESLPSESRLPTSQSSDRTPTGILSAITGAQRGVSLELESVTKIYPGQPAAAVDNFSMRIEPGELIMFVGPSGCGKTTTMKMVNRIIEPTSGSIRIAEEDILSIDPDRLRRHIGYVIQQIGLFPHRTIAENIATVPKLLGWSKAKIAERVEELLVTVQLDPGEFARRYPRQLSGGQQQRAGVARALAADPPVMLMDEPFGATDPITRERLQAEFLRLQDEIGKTVIFVTHDFDEAIRLGDRIAVLSERSHIEQFDTPANVLAHPANAYVESFIGQGAALKRLALIPIRDAVFGAEVAGAPSLDETGSLRDALDLLVVTGARAVNVCDAGNRVIGSLSNDEVSAALRSERVAGRV